MRKYILILILAAPFVANAQESMDSIVIPLPEGSALYEQIANLEKASAEIKAEIDKMGEGVFDKSMQLYKGLMDIQNQYNTILKVDMEAREIDATYNSVKVDLAGNEMVLKRKEE